MAISPQVVFPLGDFTSSALSTCQFLLRVVSPHGHFSSGGLHMSVSLHGCLSSGGLSTWLFFLRVVSPQGGLFLLWFLIKMVSFHDDFFSGWRLLGVVSHGGFS